MKPVEHLASSHSLSGEEIPPDRIAALAPVLIWAADQHKNCYFLNKKWFEFTGDDIKRSFAQSWISNIHPDDLRSFHQAFDKALGAKSSFHYKVRVKHISGAYRWIEGTAAVNYNKDAKAIGYVGSGNDVHDQLSPYEELLRKNQELEHQNNLVETVLDSTISMISVVDKNLNYITFNHKLEAHTGLAKEKVIGRNVFEVFPQLQSTQYEAHVKKALKGEIVQTHISESPLQKGKFFETFFIPLRSKSNEIEAVIVKIRDRTEDILLHEKLIENNKLLEEQNRQLKTQSHFIESLFDATVDVIAVFDKEYRFISMNKKGVERYGLKKEEIIGKKILELFPAVENSGMYRDIKRAMGGEFVYDLSYTSSVLTETRFENHYVPLYDDKNEVYAVMVIGHDISKLMEATEQLRISNEILEEKNTELIRSNLDLEQFAYVASHDLQEPVRKIATYANKLLTRSKEKLSDETAMYLQRINKSTGRMYELINGLLLYSRVTRHNNLFTVANLDGIFKQVLADYELKIQQQRAVIKYQQLPTELEAVPLQISQLFSNLLNNSLKFTKKDAAPVVQIGVSDLTEEQKKFYNLNLKARYVNIFYVDNGIGFEQQYAEKIFELFQRLHGKGVYEGSGIGLAICKKIVDNHHGMIYAFSEPDKGVTFQIILPYRQKPFA